MEFLEKNSDKVAKVLKAIASPVRLKILRALSDNSLSVANIQKQVGTAMFKRSGACYMWLVYLREVVLVVCD